VPEFEDPFAGMDFKAAIRDARSGLLLKPIITNFLFDAKFPDFDMQFRKHEMERKPDGWFHPSTHPLWSARQLYAYLAHPALMRPEKKEYMGTLSVTVGQAMHGFMEVCLEAAGVRPPALNTCTTCAPDAPAHNEPGVVDAEIGERGHMDGVLDLSSLSVPGPEYLNPVFEFKTSNDRKASKLTDLDVETYRKMWPDYYAQNQSYMRLSGRRLVVVLVMVMGFPWEMREVHVPYDPAFASQIRDKFLAVRRAVQDQNPPPGCCGGRTGCPSAGACAKIAAAAPAPMRLAL
jgi:hypothetical protein